MMERPARSSQRSQEGNQRQALFQQNAGDAVQELVTILEKELPAPTAECGREEQIQVSLRDGITLATQVLLPSGIGPWPVCQLPDIINTRTKRGSQSHERSQEELYIRV